MFTSRLWLRALAVALPIVVGASNAKASVIYTLTGSGSDAFGTATTFGFTYTSPTFITSDTFGVTPDSCQIGDGSAFTCTTMDFDVSPNQFAVDHPPGLDDYLSFGSHDIGTGSSGGGFLFFQAGAFGAVGIYSTVGYPMQTPDTGNFGQATLTVTTDVSTVPLPAALPLLAGGIGAFGLVAFRGRRKRGVV